MVRFNLKKPLDPDQAGLLRSVIPLTLLPVKTEACMWAPIRPVCRCSLVTQNHSGLVLIFDTTIDVFPPHIFV